MGRRVRRGGGAPSRCRLFCLTPSAFRFGTRRDDWDWARTKPAPEKCVGGGAPEPSTFTFIIACPTPVIQPHPAISSVSDFVSWNPESTSRVRSVSILAFSPTDGALTDGQNDFPLTAPHTKRKRKKCKLRPSPKGYIHLSGSTWGQEPTPFQSQRRSTEEKRPVLKIKASEFPRVTFPQPSTSTPKNKARCLLPPLCARSRPSTAASTRSATWPRPTSVSEREIRKSKNNRPRRGRSRSTPSAENSPARAPR